MAAVDFERNGYTTDWSPERSAALHSNAAGWDSAGDDPVLSQGGASWATSHQGPWAEAFTISTRHAGSPFQEALVRLPRSWGSVGPWEPGGISEAQWKMGNDHADGLGIPYNSRGASVDAVPTTSPKTEIQP